MQSILTKFIVSIIASIVITCSAANAEPSKEYVLKAAFIYNFTKFIEWKPDNSSINICIIGNNNFGNALNKIEQRSNNKTKYKVTNSKSDKCSVQVYDNYKGTPHSKSNLLTIGNGEEFIEKGGIIAFLHKDRKIKFIINQKAAKKAGLRIQPQLLELAYKVIR